MVNRWTVSVGNSYTEWIKPDATSHISHPGVLGVSFRETDFYLKARYRFIHRRHSTGELAWSWPQRSPQLVYDHEKDGI